MKKTVLIVAGWMIAAMAMAQQLPAFPEAEGFGKYTTGGRGGQVYYVTSLDDCTDANLVPGTLRWALRNGADGDDTPRTVLFKVAGTIALKSKLKLNHANVTIAGQTAPAGGVCIAGANIYVCKPNVIIRYIRFRAGDILQKNYPCLDVENTKNVIIDHCSMTWSMEECLTMYDCDSTTVQWTIIGEGLYSSYHSKGARAYATQWGGEHGTMHHCLITNCYSRTPRFNGVRDEADLANGKHNHDAQVDNEFVNNVVFNWGKSNSVYGGENDTTKNKDAEGHPLGWNRVYMLHNYFVPGPTTTKKLSSVSKYHFVEPSSKNGYGQWMLEGNQFSVQSELNTNNYYSSWPAAAGKLTAMVDSSNLDMETAVSGYQSVLAGVGVSLPRYDEQDARLIAEAAGTVTPQFHGTADPSLLGIIDGQTDITFTKNDLFLLNDSLYRCYPYLDVESGDKIAVDTDGDGLPDGYETAIGLNPNDASDGAAIGSDGYSALEVYLNAIASGTIQKTLYETVPYTSVQPMHTANDTYHVSTDAVKRIEDGGIVIRRGENTYTITGTKH